MKRTRVMLVSPRCEFGEVDENLRVILRGIERAGRRGAQLVCFPEIALQGYHNNAALVREQAQRADGPACAAIAAAAGRAGVVVSVGMALRVGRRVLNAQVFIAGRGVIGYAAKVHLCGGEEKLFDAADTWPVIDLGFARIGTLLCFDGEFPEAARCLALDGANIVLMSFATGRCDSCGRPQKAAKWAQQVMRWAPSRAYDNRVFVLGVNHAGDVRDDEGLAVSRWATAGATHRWPGYSFAIGPDGATLRESPRAHNRPRDLVIDLSPDLIKHWRSCGGDFLRFRRPEAYRRILER